MYDIISFGAIYLDINCHNFPIDAIQPEKEVYSPNYSLELGGSAVISVSIASALGLKTAFIGKVGTDIFALQLKQKLQEKNIDAHLMESINPTNISINYISPQGRAVMTTVGNANQSLQADELFDHLSSLISQTKYIYLGGVLKFPDLIPFYYKLVDQALISNCRIILDHGRVTNIVTEKQKQLIRDIVPNVSIYIPSIDEAQIIWSGNSAKSTLSIIRQAAPLTTAIITQGPDGAIGEDHNGNFASSNATKIIPINTVGAGDTFNAGYMFAILRGYSFPDALNFAQSLAEYKITKPTLPTREELLSARLINHLTI